MARQYVTYAASCATAADLATSSRLCTCAVMGCCVTHERCQRRLPLTTCMSILRPIWVVYAWHELCTSRMDALARRTAARARLGGVRRRERDCKSHRKWTEIAENFLRGAIAPPSPPSGAGCRFQDAHLLAHPDRSASLTCRDTALTTCNSALTGTGREFLCSTHKGPRLSPA